MAEEKTATALATGGPTYCRVEVIAQLFGVTVRRIQQLTQDGTISTTETTEGNRSVRRYELETTVQKYIKYLSDKAHGKTGRSEKESELREEKLRADIALKESQGELHKLKTQIAQGKYIDIEEVKIDYQKFFMIFKKFAISLSGRVAGMVAGKVEPVQVREIEKDITQEIKVQLSNFVVAGVALEAEDDEPEAKPAKKKTTRKKKAETDA